MNESQIDTRKLLTDSYDQNNEEDKNISNKKNEDTDNIKNVSELVKRWLFTNTDKSPVKGNFKLI